MNPEKAVSRDKKELNVKKEDYEYKRNGTCNIFMISEPFNNYRDCKVTERRTKEDFASF